MFWDIGKYVLIEDEPLYPKAQTVNYRPANDPGYLKYLNEKWERRQARNHENWEKRKARRGTTPEG